MASNDLQYRVPPFATDGSLRVTDCTEDCILQLDMFMGQGATVGFCVWGKNDAHKGATVLTLCLDTLNNVISNNEVLWSNQSSCYWTNTGDYSSPYFDIG